MRRVAPPASRRASRARRASSRDSRCSSRPAASRRARARTSMRPFAGAVRLERARPPPPDRAAARAPPRARRARSRTWWRPTSAQRARREARRPRRALPSAPEVLDARGPHVGAAPRARSVTTRARRALRAPRAARGESAPDERRRRRAASAQAERRLLARDRLERAEAPRGARVPALVIDRRRRARAIAASAAISPGWFMPISTTAARCSGRSRSSVSGTPQWLLRLPSVRSVGPARREHRRHQLLGRGLAGAAGDADQQPVPALAVAAREALQRGGDVVHHHQRPGLAAAQRGVRARARTAPRRRRARTPRRGSRGRRRCAPGSGTNSCPGASVRVSIAAPSTPRRRNASRAADRPAPRAPPGRRRPAARAAPA